jgi:hypothetical protein
MEEKCVLNKLGFQISNIFLYENLVDYDYNITKFKTH